ncbi:MAG: transporter [Pirellulales bacterium]|nr:transporter [Pirellulales bacterium]
MLGHRILSAFFIIAATASALPAQQIAREVFKPWIMQGQSFDDSLVADRPDFTEASSVVGRYRLQIEGGYTYTRDDSAGVLSREHVLPELLLRYGLNDSLELRIGWAGHLFSSQIGSAELLPFESSGGSGLSVGFKEQFSDNNGYIPESSLIYSLDLPGGDSEVGSDRVGVSIVSAYSWELTDRISIGGNTGCNFISPGGDYFNNFAQSLVVSLSVSERFGIYQEWIMLAYSGADDSRPEHYYDGGITYLFTPNFQWDWRAGVGLTEASADFFTGTGFAVRW